MSISQWPFQKLNELIDVKHGFAFKSDYFCNNGPYILLTPGNFLETGGFRWLGDKQKFYSGSVQNPYILKQGDVLVAMTEQAPGLLGSTIVIPDNGKYLHNQRLGLIQIKEESLLSKDFVYHLFNSIFVRKPISETAAGTKVKHTSPEKIGKIMVPIPPLPQQHGISEILSTWDQEIEKTERLIEAKENYYHTLKLNLLRGNKRIKGHNKRWQRCRLSEVLVEHGELSTGQEKVYSVSVHKGLINQIEHLGRSFAAKTTANYNLVKPGDIVYTKSPTGDFPYGIIKQSQLDFPVIVSPLYGVFTPKTIQLGTFLHYYFDSPVNIGNYLRPIIQKGAKNTIGITNSRFLSNNLDLPTCDDETKAIAMTLNTAQQEIDLLKKQTDVYRKQKLGLMQKLLTGQWRVKANEGVM